MYNKTPLYVVHIVLILYQYCNCNHLFSKSCTVYKSYYIPCTLYTVYIFTFVFNNIKSNICTVYSMYTVHCTVYTMHTSIISSHLVPTVTIPIYTLGLFENSTISLYISLLYSSTWYMICLIDY